MDVSSELNQTTQKASGINEQENSAKTLPVQMNKNKRVIIPEFQNEIRATPQIKDEPKQEDDRITTGTFHPATKALFIPSSSSGCQPLKIHFKNLSINSQEYFWNFGDGGTSGLSEPEYVFDEPGKFMVSLTVMDENRQVSRYSQTIEVFKMPDASFEFDSQKELAEGEPTYFYNYSTGATRFLWDFGDGNGSESSEPVHFYREKGKVEILLKVWSAKGCMDSLRLRNSWSDKETEITFPTAFSPNMDGPTGGYFIPGERNNMVFHPYIVDVPVEYQLKIFNRKGNLIFESNDFQMGWDGYYQQELQPRGVYIYKARGRYTNGKPFVKLGDVTLIWNKKY